MPVEEVLKLCDIHQLVLDGHIDHSGAKEAPAGHPADTFKKENRELEKIIDMLEMAFAVLKTKSITDIKQWMLKVHALLNNLMDMV